MTRMGETRGTRCRVPLEMREFLCVCVASSPWALSGLFIAFFQDQGSTTERAAVGEGIIEASSD
jgi:hypothetical protein